ncbi:HNH endonuclease [Malacoplasma penetrans]|uniref:HNH endonuclease signature motif containing protein n=1 Tax=Malacoplasma penetrans TaxID=28227 RepID=UPI001011C406|nr:HNH endonuclease signature motif containing protein [Malacoplasma penetrans]RXY96820.1 HNH endonuclease [Malacoplasma penetrans]
MKERKYDYLHIIDGKIQHTPIAHMCENERDKTFCIKTLIEDLGIDNYDDVSNNRKNLFRINFDNFYWNIFIEFTDGGGMDTGYNKKIKKVSIPFGNNVAFTAFINNFEKVLIVNIYIPLKTNLKKDLELDWENRVYAIIDPRQVYSSKVVKNEKMNPTSRWINLEDVLEANNNKKIEYIENKSKNVYIVSWVNIKSFFINKIKPLYKTMINENLYSELDELDIQNLQKEEERYSIFRKIFRDKLIAERGVKCEFKYCSVKLPELLIASHIEPVYSIVQDDKIDLTKKIEKISDSNNGFLLCRNHDGLFDRCLITFDKHGFLKLSETIKNHQEDLNLKCDIQTIDIPNKTVIEYLKFHNKLFKRKNVPF